MSSVVRNKTLDFCRAHFNEPVLVFFSVCRLIGYGETDRDKYYIVKYPKNHPVTEYAGTNVVWTSAVGHCMTLRALKDQDVVIPNEGCADNGETEWNNFYRLDHWLHINGAEREEEFIIDIKQGEEYEQYSHDI